MKAGQPIPKNVDDYIDCFPNGIREILKELRDTIKKAAPDAEELISYQMPAYKLKGILVYFAAMTNHIGFYPTSTGIASFRKELSAYKLGKGSVQLPLDKPLPLSLISKIVKYRVKENLARAEAKGIKPLKKIRLKD